MNSVVSRFIRELLLLSICLLGLDLFVFSGRLFSWQPSPLWLLVILLAPRHGAMAGIISGLVAAGIYLWYMTGQGHVLQNLLHREPEAMIRPALFLLVGGFLGSLRESQVKRGEFFQNKARDLDAQLGESEVRRSQLERGRIEMEKRIAGQGNTLFALRESFKRLEDAQSEEDLLFILDLLLREEIQAEACGVWRICESREYFLAGRMDSKIPPLALWVSKKRPVVTSAEWSAAHPGDNPGADMAAMIHDSGSQWLVVALSGVPFANITRNLVLQFGLLAAEAGSVLGALHDRQALRRNSMHDNELGLMSEAYLRRRVDEELSLARRHNTPLALIACQVSNAPHKLRARLELVLSCSIRASIRFSDGVAFFAEPRAFVVVLPQCDLPCTEIVRRKIESSMAQLNLQTGEGKEIFRLSWNILASDDQMSGDALYEKLFANMTNARNGRHEA